VNRVIILMVVLLIVFFSDPAALFAAADSNSAAQTKSVTPAKAEKPMAKVTLKKGLKADANEPAGPKKYDPNTDPNVIKAKWQKELDDEIGKIEKTSQDESREWTQRAAEGRINRLKATDKQVTAEFDLIRKLATEEKATKTVEAIDRILVVRKERLDKLIDSIEESRKKERQKELQEKEKRDREQRERRPRDSDDRRGR